MVESPEGSLTFSNLPELEELSWRRNTSIVLILILIIIVNYFLWLSPFKQSFEGDLASRTILIAIILILIFGKLIGMIQRTLLQELLDRAAVGVGHPWHPSEEAGDASVWILNSDDDWSKVPPKIRIHAQQDPTLARTFLKRNDSDGKLLLIWNGDLDNKVENMVSLLNMALALRDAQERPDGADDPFESAREREDGDSMLDHRSWEETRSGSMAPEPGALLRRLRSESTDIIAQDEEGG